VEQEEREAWRLQAAPLHLLAETSLFMFFNRAARVVLAAGTEARVIHRHLLTRLMEVVLPITVFT
jgi:hypothetical protein